MMSDVLLEALREAGIPPPPREVVSGHYTRWGKFNEYYAIRLSDGSGYYFGNFKESDSGKTVFEKDANGNRYALIEEARRKLFASQDEAHERIAQSCTKFWQNMKPITEHPYLQRKQVKSYGLKLYMDKLVIPLMDLSGKIWSFQYIAPDGSKHFRSGGRKHGCFYVIGDAKDAPLLYVCEGYATAATIYECTGVPTIVAFDAGNIYPATLEIRQNNQKCKIVICADNDAYGPTNTGLTKAQNAAQYFNASVVYPKFKDTTSKPTDFNDLLILEGADEVKRQLAEPKSAKQPNEGNDSKQSGTQETETSESIPGFCVTDTALMYFDEAKKEFAKICAPLKIIALTSELEDENAGRLVEFKDRNGIVKQVKIFDAWLSKDGSKIHDVLYKYGLDIDTGAKAKRKLNEYLNASNPKKLITYTLRSGWHKGIFLTATDIYGNNSCEICHIPAAEPAKLSSTGSLLDWQCNISRLCINNSRLMLAMSAAFASMILTPCAADNFFLHFYGRSSQGKTTMLDVAASVFGDHSYTRTWRMTDNGLEGIAMAHNDLCLFLDEISECDPYKIGAMAYMLVNGSGKTRATTQGLARRVMRWTLGGVSTGEEQLGDIIKATGRNPKAGQLLRILSIPAIPDNSSFGLFEDIHGFPTSADFAIHLKTAAQMYHGTAFPAFIRAIISDYDDVRSFYKHEMERAKKEFLPLRATGQYIRAFKTFATCGIGGILATKYGITAWNGVDIMATIMKCFSSWLESRDGTGSQEDKQALTQIRLFFEKYGDTRFQQLSDDIPTTERIPYERAGYRTYLRGGVVFYVFKSYFEEVIARGLDLKQVKNLLRDLGILETDSDHSRFDKNVWIRGKTVRMYVINHKIFEGDD
ncbi:MAG: DUF927 domain-containing protein [Alphaproteobacteria bacterium]|nr:DUF927 domain-containing protein [Alphaproteobacteria bacterium]